MTETALLDAMRTALHDARPQRLGVAVSGGGDSMAALDLAHRVVGNVQAVTVDHGLRPEAAAEAAGVGAFCAERGIAHQTLRWGWDWVGNVSARARDARFSMIGEWAVRQGVDLVILGHTQDDLAETFLMRLSRGSGVDGLSAMDAQFRRDGVTWLRPLLGISRESCRDYLRAQGIGWVDDPTNEDATYLRARTRAALSDLGINATTLADTAHRLAEVRQALNWQLRAFVRENVRQDRGDLLISGYRDLPTEITRRLFSYALRWVGGGHYTPRHDHILRATEATSKRTLSGCVLLPEQDGLRIARELQRVHETAVSATEIWDGRWHLSGPDAAHLTIRALGDAITQTPWRETGLPLVSLIASPAIWDGDSLIAAPIAGLPNGWTATADARGNFADFCGSD